MKAETQTQAEKIAEKIKTVQAELLKKFIGFTNIAEKYSDIRRDAAAKLEKCSVKCDNLEHRLRTSIEEGNFANTESDRKLVVAEQKRRAELQSEYALLQPSATEEAEKGLESMRRTLPLQLGGTFSNETLPKFKALIEKKFKEILAARDELQTLAAEVNAALVANGAPNFQFTAEFTRSPIDRSHWPIDDIVEIFRIVS